MKNLTVSILLGGMLATNALGQGTILWDESANGQLSNNFEQPTFLGNLALGTNSLAGTTTIEPTGGNYALYGDYFTFSLAPNSIVTSAFLQLDKSRVAAWLGNPAFTEQIGASNSVLDGDLLNQWGLLFLGAGTYGMYLVNQDAQQLISVAHYRLDFVVQAIPEPASSTLFLAGLGYGIWRGRRRR